MKKKKETAVVQWKMPTMPDRKQIQKRAAPLLDESEKFVIKSDDHFVASWTLVERHDLAIKTIEEKFDPFVAGLYRLHRMAIEMRDEFLKPIRESKRRLLDRRQAYREIQEEARRKADEAKAKALQAAQQKELEKAAKQAEKKGESEVAEALREQKSAVPVPYFDPTPAVPQQQGSVVKERWCFEITDPDKVEREYCTPDPKLIRPLVESLGLACKISGIRIWLEKKEHSRSVHA